MKIRIGAVLTGAILVFAAIAMTPRAADACAFCLEGEDPEGSWFGWCEDGGSTECASIAVAAMVVSCWDTGSCSEWSMALDGTSVLASGAEAIKVDGLLRGSKYLLNCAGNVAGRYYERALEDKIVAATETMAI